MLQKSKKKRRRKKEIKEGEQLILSAGAQKGLIGRGLVG
jgi:hypothetical protein